MSTTHHWSDCAVHNAPAMAPGPCDCGGDAPPPDPRDAEIARLRDVADNLRAAIDIALNKGLDGFDWLAAWRDGDAEAMDEVRALLAEGGR